jgi:hypothetical protein
MTFKIQKILEMNYIMLLARMATPINPLGQFAHFNQLSTLNFQETRSHLIPLLLPLSTLIFIPSPSLTFYYFSLPLSFELFVNLSLFLSFPQLLSWHSPSLFVSLTWCSLAKSLLSVFLFSLGFHTESIPFLSLWSLGRSHHSLSPVVSCTLTLSHLKIINQDYGWQSCHTRTTRRAYERLKWDK